jgi:hypothetical protein
MESDDDQSIYAGAISYRKTVSLVSARMPAQCNCKRFRSHG